MDRAEKIFRLKNMFYELELLGIIKEIPTNQELLDLIDKD